MERIFCRFTVLGRINNRGICVSSQASFGNVVDGRVDKALDYDLEGRGFETPVRKFFCHFV